ncbi:hypothetical protein HX049_11740 [Myroides odoratimimus]|uniref:hypothetical protein n=1 Tax=Myroides odoratimimus TaxID=76832 RepID=UPI002577F8A8|nr:hypothetical protein [Myroides odoratimimus]MDM1397850.1 hypothetical protein [Myroides odoratimimus]
MAYESPLFHSSLELFAHSIEHFNWGSEKDRKFTILHLANSVELIFKDLLLDLGESIYKNPKETISISGAIDTLTKDKKIVIPNLNKLELLIDERNSLQHRYGFPNELTTIFYMEATYDFFRDFLKENYDLEIDKILQDFLSEDDFTNFQLREVKTIHELDKLSKLSKVHPIGALLSAYTYLERKIQCISDIMTEALDKLPKSKNSANAREIRFTLMRVNNLDYIPRLFEVYGIESEINERRKFIEFRELRNQTTHGKLEPDSKTVNETVKFIKNIEPKIDELIKSIKNEPLKYIEERVFKRYEIVE